MYYKSLCFGLLFSTAIIFTVDNDKNLTGFNSFFEILTAINQYNPQLVELQNSVEESTRKEFNVASNTRLCKAYANAIDDVTKEIIIKTGLDRAKNWTVLGAKMTTLQHLIAERPYLRCSDHQVRS